MSRSWPYLSAVAVVGVLAGTAIGGRPVGRDEFVISPDQIPTTTVAAVTESDAGTALTPATTTTVAPAATTGTDTPGTETASTDTTVASLTRVVLVDASGSENALTAASDALTADGESVEATATADPAEATIVYYRAGFLDSAASVATVIGLPESALVLLADQVISDQDAQGDVIVVLGADAAR